MNGWNISWTWELNIDTPEGILIAGGAFIAMIVVWIIYELWTKYRGEEFRKDK